MKPLPVLLALACLTPAPGKEKNPPAPANEKILVLDPIKIQGSPIISYAIDISVYADPKTKKVNRIFITRVIPGTDAERAGLQAGDEIVRLDGVAVKELDSEVSVRSPLGRIFLNRRPGEPLNLVVLTRRPEKVTLQAQRGSPLDYR